MEAVKHYTFWTLAAITSRYIWPSETRIFANDTCCHYTGIKNEDFLFFSRLSYTEHKKIKHMEAARDVKVYSFWRFNVLDYTE